MKYVDLFNPTLSRVGLQESLKYNLISGKLVTSIVKSSLGPRGMEKMYIDILGEDTVTGHGGAFLRKVDVLHPAGKSVVDAVNIVDTHVGDGTTSAAVLIGGLLSGAEKMLMNNIPVAVITRSYENSLDCALSVLDAVKIKSDRRNVEIMRSLLFTCLEGKAVFELYDNRTEITDMLIDAVCRVADFDGGRVPVDEIKIEEKMGSIQKTRLVMGTVIDKTIDSSAMPKSIKDARILLINEPLETMRTKTDAQINMESPKQMGQFLDQENNDLTTLVDCILSSGANVVISRKGISEFVQGILASKGIISMRRVKYNDLWWLEKATGASTCNSIENISDAELGFASSIYQETVGGDEMVFVVSEKPASVTLLLCANSKRYLDEIHRNVLNALYVLRNFIENPYIVYGAGSVEWLTAQRIRERALSVEGRAQIGMLQFAEALEQIPLTLARNVGMDVLDTQTRLHNKFDKEGIMWYGINAVDRRISDMSSSQIIETVIVKQQVLKTAVEATNLLLNVDDVFVKDLIDNTHCHIDGTVHAHHDGGKAHNHFEQEGLEQRQMHQYY